MKLIAAFQDEHLLIDRVLGSFRVYVERLVGGDADPADGARYARFFGDFVGGFHAEREEQVFLAALVQQAELPRERGPVHAVVHEHGELHAWLGEMRPLLHQWPLAPDEADRLQALATLYTQTLWRHIDAENSVLYPEGEERLGRNGIRELPDRPLSEAEAAAQADAAALLLRHPPREDAALTRGDGCYLCRAHGSTCDGLEAEWWSDLEWDEFQLR
jgi:hemerythrin-like domain-containing protein